MHHPFKHSGVEGHLQDSMAYEGRKGLIPSSVLEAGTQFDTIDEETGMLRSSHVGE